MRFLSILISVFISLTDLLAQTNLTIRSAAELKNRIYRTPAIGATFELDATIIEKNEQNITFADSSGACYASSYDQDICKAQGNNGDFAHISGVIVRDARYHNVCAVCTGLTIIRPGEPLEPIDTTISEINRGDLDFRLIRFRGTLRNFSHDETDAQYIFCLIEDNGASMTVPVLLSNKNVDEKVFTIGSVVEVSGLCHFGFNCARILPGHFIANAQIRLIAPPPDDPFDAPPLDDVRRLTTAEIARLGRRLVSGRVLATYGSNRFVIRSSDGQVHNLRVSSGNLPTHGDCITAVGYPETDSYNNHLSCIKWRLDASASNPDNNDIRIIEIEDLFNLGNNKPEIKPDLHGAIVRVRGKYKDRAFNKFHIQHPLSLTVVDASSCPEILKQIEPESTVEATGVCIIDIELGQPNEIFPHIRGFSIVLRNANDIRILARPPWWNTIRLLTAIGILLAAFLAILIWNILLRRISERRGKELAQEQVARSQADLRTLERTRLAVELHDSLAQNLIGAAMEIKAARRFSDTDPQSMKLHLGIAEKTIDSCRGDVRNCIYDLRSKALEENDLNIAIRQTLEPHLENAKLTMRFNIPRKALSINALHTFICIIRELTINAIRHGHAKSIWVAGSIEGEHLKFSVRDDGCGFDPEQCPGMENGHFGLQGIRERIKRFGGSFGFEKLQTAGMKAVIKIGLTEIK